MQIITMYLRASSVKGTLVDEWNQTLSSLPALTRGLRAELVLKLVDANGEALADEYLAQFVSWDFALADDWDTSTKPQLRVAEGITVTGNEVHVPLTETNTEELIAALGTSESATFGCELAGFETGETNPGFLLQFDILVRNRRADAGTGTPEPVGDGTYSAAQIRALFAARLAVQLSDDGESWYDAEGAEAPQSARYYRFRNALVGTEWSDPLPLIVGPRGERSTVAVGTVSAGAAGTQPVIVNSGDEHDAVFDFTIPQGSTGLAATIQVGDVSSLPAGEEPVVENRGTASAAVFDFKLPTGPQGEAGRASYIYVAYAEKSDGTGFSLVPSSTLKYRAEILSETPIEAPVFADFAGATWVKYLGDDATVYGDILVADEDTSVAKVTRIVFENAKIRKGIDGEVIVNFKEAGVTDDEMNDYAVVNARTRLSPWTNGGGSQSAMPGLEIETAQEIPELAEFPQYSSFIGQIN